MTTIKDQKFLTTFYRRFCLRPVTGRMNQNALAKQHIEVKPSPFGLTVSICDWQGSLIELGWDGDEAWPISYHNANTALHQCDRHDLSLCIRRFLRKHNVTIPDEKTGAA